jgi:Protein of unknown function (DUF3613)
MFLITPSAQPIRLNCAAALFTAALCVSMPSWSQAVSEPVSRQAADAAAVEPSPPPTGTATRKWTRAQAQQEQATRNRQTLSGPVMTSIHQRYVESFRNKIEPTSLHNRRSVKED